MNGTNLADKWENTFGALALHTQYGAREIVVKVAAFLAVILFAYLSAACKEEKTGRSQQAARPNDADPEKSDGRRAATGDSGAVDDGLGDDDGRSDPIGDDSLDPGVDNDPLTNSKTNLSIGTNPAVGIYTGNQMDPGTYKIDNGTMLSIVKAYRAGDMAMVTAEIQQYISKYGLRQLRRDLSEARRRDYLSWFDSVRIWNYANRLTVRSD